MPIPIRPSSSAAHSSESNEQSLSESSVPTLQSWIDQHNALPLPPGFESQLNVDGSNLFQTFMRHRNTMIKVLEELLETQMHEQIQSGQLQNSRNKYERLLQTLEGKYLIRKFQENVWDDLLEKYRLLSAARIQLKQRTIVQVKSKPATTSAVQTHPPKSRTATSPPEKSEASSSSSGSSSSLWSGAKFTKAAGLICQQWFVDHIRDPYPSDLQKERLAHQARVTYEQISAWFINARMRRWKELLRQVADGILKPSAPPTAVVESQPPPSVKPKSETKKPNKKAEPLVLPLSASVKKDVIKQSVKKKKQLDVAACAPFPAAAAALPPALRAATIVHKATAILPQLVPTTSTAVVNKADSRAVVPDNREGDPSEPSDSVHFQPMQIVKASEGIVDVETHEEAEDDDEMEIELDIGERGVDRHFLNLMCDEEFEEMLLEESSEHEEMEYQAALERDKYFVISSVAMVNALPELIPMQPLASPSLNSSASTFVPSKKVFLHETSYAKTLNDFSINASGPHADSGACAPASSTCFNSIPFVVGEALPLASSFGTSPVRSFFQLQSIGPSATSFVSATSRIHVRPTHHSAVIEPPVHSLGMSQEQLMDLNPMVAH